MKKQILLIGGLTALLFGPLKAQKADSIRAKAIYGFTHIKDTTQRDKASSEEMVLLLGTRTSAYLSMDKIRFDIQRKKDIEEQIKNSVPGKLSINIKGSPKSLTYDEFYQYPAEKKIIIKKRLVNNYLVEETLPEINWNISSDTSTISGLKCQKATARFKGRDYTAWFCPDLPFQSGPWKLNGLPGLIVEAQDAKKEVVFKFQGFEKVHNTAAVKEEEPESSIGGVSIGGKVNISGLSSAELLSSPTFYLPKGSIKTTQKEFDKLSEAMKKDPDGFINSSMAGEGRVVTGQRTMTKSKFITETVNNPIELPEVK
ncbi:GLPGLI family protein [Pedobacter sp. FW305-3-2-15-E-R2A2]|uniref:GLPGLI family protein n=1 Tax=Pedobacter sp. FW305-3-2-15-E-R2A2 TaxID=3140251 RepID=UPI0031403C4B